MGAAQGDGRCVVILTPLPAPARNVHPLRSDYVEVCWTPVVGSTAVALLRLLPAMWAEAVPVEVADMDLAQRFGLGKSDRVRQTAQRIARFCGGRWDPSLRLLEVPTALPSLSPGQLARVPEWTRARHEALTMAVAS